MQASGDLNEETKQARKNNNKEKSMERNGETIIGEKKNINNSN